MPVQCGGNSARVLNLRREVRGFNRAARGMVTSLFSIRGALLGLLGVGGIAQLGRLFTEAADTMLLASSRLRIVVRDTDEFNLVQRELFTISQETRQPLNNVIDLYARVGRATVQIGKDHEDILPFIRAVTQAIVASGATAQESRAGLIQFSQGLAAGALRGDEFRSVAEQLPRVAQAIANGLGLTIGQLRSLAHEGGLTIETIFMAFSTQYDVLQSELGAIPRTLGQSLTQVRNQFLRTVQNVNLTTNATLGLVSAVDRFRMAIAREDLVVGFVGVLRRLVNILSILLENLDSVGHAFTVVFGLAVLHSRLGRITGAVLRVAVGMISLRGAVSTAAASFLSFYTLPRRALIEIRSQIELMQVRFLVAGDHVRTFAARFTAALRSPIVTIRTLNTRLSMLRRQVSLTAILARTSFAASMTVAAGAVRVFTVALRTAGRAIRFLVRSSWSKG